MPAGHLIPHLQLTLDGQIYLGELQYPCRQFIPDGNIEFFPLVTSQFFVVLDAVVMQQNIDRVIGLRITCPTQRIDIQIVDAAEVLAP